MTTTRPRVDVMISTVGREERDMARTGLPMRQPQSRTMRFLVDSRIRWDARALPRVVVEDVQRALTFPNRTKQIAKEQKVRGWQQMPDTVTLFDPRSLPRGFALQMRRILERHGIQIDWADRRVHVPVWTGGWKTVQLRDYQEQACDRIEAVQQGIWQSPPASGWSGASSSSATRRALWETVTSR